jgi:hypothetical protein
MQIVDGAQAESAAEMESEARAMQLQMTYASKAVTGSVAALSA